MVWALVQLVPRGLGLATLVWRAQAPVDDVWLVPAWKEQAAPQEMRMFLQQQVGWSLQCLVMVSAGRGVHGWIESATRHVDCYLKRAEDGLRGNCMTLVGLGHGSCFDRFRGAALRSL